MGSEHAAANPHGDPTACPRLYLAGPEVFLADALAIAGAKKRLCAEHGFAGVFPLDVEIEQAGGLSPLETAARISRSNEALMRGCDLLIANCTPFRGVSMDTGTAYEVGFMRALGRPVFGYSNVPGDYKQRAVAFATSSLASWGRGERAAAIEDFGLPENLMISVPMLEFGAGLVCSTAHPGEELTDLAGFKRCLELARAFLAPSAIRPER